MRNQTASVEIKMEFNRYRSYGDSESPDIIRLVSVNVAIHGDGALDEAETIAQRLNDLLPKLNG